MIQNELLWTAIGDEYGFRLVSVDGVDVEYIDDDTAAQNQTGFLSAV